MACGVDLVTPANDPCLAGATALGKQVVGIIVQDASGVAPTFTTLSSVQAALADTGADQVFIITNLAASVVPEGTDDTITGNDVPYGGTQITGRTRTLQSQLQYLSPSQVAVADAFGARQVPVRHWEYDDAGYLQGPFENSTATIGVLQRAGIGGAPNRKALTVSTRLPGLVEPPIRATPIPGLNALQNAA